MTKLSKGDPTHTTTLRKQFASQFSQRFTSIKMASNKSIVANDCFGLKQGVSIFARLIGDHSWKGNIKPIPTNEYQFSTTTKKQLGFMEWLAKSEEASVFEVKNIPTTAPGIKPIWTNLYIKRSYSKGMQWATAKINQAKGVRKKLGISTEKLSKELEFLEEAFNSPLHAEKVGLIYTRTYTDLKGITASMDAQISRELANGLALGQHPSKIAKAIADRIDKIGITRARVLARTEVIRAHHVAAINTYRSYGIEQVKVEAEWLTAGDSKVCSICAPLEDKIFTLDEIEGKIPAHPNCRCAAAPYVE